jgi:hypothetical protein
LSRLFIGVYHLKYYFWHFSVCFSFIFDENVATQNVNKNTIRYEYFKGNSDQASNFFFKASKATRFGDPWFIGKNRKKNPSEKDAGINFQLKKFLRFMIFFVLLTKREILHNTNQGLYHGPRASAKLIDSSINLN